ncbi:PIG-L family deacetylase [Massilia sp. YIM B02763]|uniref:PIG-L deacetylase family protein n=1 Tax=Massilia sp. YIM B02763 TaxID=3050130 RepID=UPI0025B6DEA4|nr:PIG-L family deacetylase [Massilia sp. YIM B02763]MDN4051670.1 PIG-L family deacetylase [Massilia sp. YIM B02763]
MDAVDRSRHIAGLGTPAQAWLDDPALAQVPAVGLDALVPEGRRAVVVAPHPDDEILSCGGLLHLLELHRRPFVVAAVTDGEGSHAGSAEWPVERLRATRPQETLGALDSLGIAAPQVVRLRVPDGGVTAAEEALARRLAGLLAPGDVVVTTWRYDGHPDHEATARACAAAARAAGAALLEVPVWGWHWSAPGDGAIPFAQARKLPLPPALVARKRAAMACFRSQLTEDASTGALPIVFPQALERLLNPYELYLHEPRPTEPATAF